MLRILAFVSAPFLALLGPALAMVCYCIGAVGGAIRWALDMATATEMLVHPSPASVSVDGLQSVQFLTDNGDFRRTLFDVLESDEVFEVGPDEQNLSMEEQQALTKQRMATLVAADVARVEDTVENTLQFIAAHETLALWGDPSLVYMFSVMLNLWGGTILKLGSDAQRATWLPMINAFSDAHRGCFALTEIKHGVLSGLLVDTTAEYDDATGEWVIHTPTPDARKSWISFAADAARMAIVFASLIINGTDEGIHAFLVPLRSEDGAPLPGVTIENMGHKSCVNGNDNAILSFDHVRVPRDALLSRFSQVSAEGVFTSSIEDVRKRFLFVSDQLMSGRMCISAASNVLAKMALRSAVAYNIRRRQARPTGDPVPILEHFTQRAQLLPMIARGYALTAGLQDVKEQYAAMIAEEGAGGAWSSGMRDVVVAAVCSAKAYATEQSIRMSHVARNCAGGDALISRHGFSRFASVAHSLALVEGDSKILAQKAVKSELDLAAKAAGGRTQWMVIATMRHVASLAEIAATTGLRGPWSAQIHRLLLSARANALLRAIGLAMADVPRAERINTWSRVLLGTVLHASDAIFELAAYDRLEATVTRAVREGVDPNTVHVLRQMLVLYALDVIVEDAAWFMTNLWLRPTDAARFADARDALIRGLPLDTVRRLCDGFLM